MAFKLFLDGDGKPQFNDKGFPLYLQDGASDPVPMDVNEMIDTNRAKHGAAESARKEKEELAARFKAYEGIDPEAARKALELAKSLDEGKLLEAGKVEELRQKIIAEHQLKHDSVNKALEEEKAGRAKDAAGHAQERHEWLVKGAFDASVFLREKTVLPPEFAYASLGKNFSVEHQDGKSIVIAKDGKGNPIFSASNPSSYASPEEAIKILIEQHPQKDSLLKNPAPNGGSGTQPGGRPGTVASGTKRSQMSIEQKTDFIEKHGQEAYRALPE